MMNSRLLVFFLIFGTTFSLSYGIVIVSRAGWGARAPRSISTIPTPVSYVFIHHTATPTPLATSSANIARIESIQNYHMDSNNWDDIGYSFLIGTDGKAYEGRGWNREGAHTYGYNRVGIGIALVGDFMTSLPNSIQLQAAKDLIQFGVNNRYIASGYSLFGHRDAGQTECPGNRFYTNVKTWSNYAKKPLP